MTLAVGSPSLAKVFSLPAVRLLRLKRHNAFPLPAGSNRTRAIGIKQTAKTVRIKSLNSESCWPVPDEFGCRFTAFFQGIRNWSTTKMSITNRYHYLFPLTFPYGIPNRSFADRKLNDKPQGLCILSMEGKRLSLTALEAFCRWIRIVTRMEIISVGMCVCFWVDMGLV